MTEVSFRTQGALFKSSLREANERLILNTVRARPGISRLALRETTGLSTTAITVIVNRLRASGFLVEDKAGSARAELGRRPTSLRLLPDARFAIGVEVTPTAAYGVLADLAGDILEERTAEPEPAAVEALVRSLTRDGVLGAGVSIPGTIDRASGRVLGAPNLPRWHGATIDFDAGFPVTCENNAKLSAIATRWFGDPLSDFVFVTLRAGIGTGIIAGGQLIAGAQSRAGEFGHMTIHPEGRRCLCGNTGCWEEYASDRALCRVYLERSGNAADALAITALALEGGAAALEAFGAIAGELALGLVNIIVALNPAVIFLDHFGVIGWKLIESRVWDVLRQRVPGHLLEGVRIEPAKQGEHAARSGAVALILSRFFYANMVY